MPTRTLAFDSEEAMAPRERLHITIRSDSVADDRSDDAFVMGVPKEHHLLDVPTKAQSIKHIEDLAAKYEEWLTARDMKRAATGFQDTFKFVKNQEGEGESQKDDDDDDDDDEGSTDTSSDEDAEGSVDEAGPNNDADTTEVRRRRRHLTPTPSH